MRPSIAALGSLALLSGCSSPKPDHPSASAVSASTGLILPESEGERRIRRPPPSGVATLRSPYVIKVDGKNGGSPDFFMGYEDIAPGDGISPHQHPFADEILFVHRGSGVASVGSREAPVAAGTTIYIPRNNRASLRNTGKDPMTIAFIFPRAGIEEYFRATSVAEGERAEPFTAEEFSRIRAQHQEHITFERP